LAIVPICSPIARFASRQNKNLPFLIAKILSALLCHGESGDRPFFFGEIACIQESEGCDRLASDCDSFADVPVLPSVSEASNKVDASMIPFKVAESTSAIEGDTVLEA
jgi:hypothetical protein